ncbi:MAG: gliding motility-associated C-terminal domain-containing protein, partial [Saprospiraceae bacterium]
TDPCLAVSPGTPVVFHDYPIAFSGADKVLGCQPDYVELSAAGSSSGNDIRYAWVAVSGGSIDGPANLNIIKANHAGSYILYVRNVISGCISYDTVEVTPSQLSIQSIEIKSTPPLCTDQCNGTIDIKNGDSSWLYDFGGGLFETATFIQSACPGVQAIAIRDTFGCIADTIVMIDNPLPVEVDLGPDQLIALGDSIVLNAASANDIVAFNWMSTNPCTTCQQIVVRPSETTNYQVFVTDQNGCEAMDDIIISIDFPHNIYVPTIFSPNGDQINDLFIISGSRDVMEIESLEIFDRWGNKIFFAEHFQPDDPSKSWDGTFLGNHLNPGVYVYNLKVLFNNNQNFHKSGDFTLLR